VDPVTVKLLQEGVPVVILTTLKLAENSASSPVPGAPLGLQLPAVDHVVLTAPVQVLRAMSVDPFHHGCVSELIKSQYPSAAL